MLIAAREEAATRIDAATPWATCFGGLSPSIQRNRWRHPSSDEEIMRKKKSFRLGLRPNFTGRALLTALLLLLVAMMVSVGVLPALAQQEGPQGPPASQDSEPPTPPQNRSQPPPQRTPPPPSEPQAAIQVQSNLVDVDATVTDQDVNLVTGLKCANFRVLDDGQPQQTTNFSPTDAPLTI